MMQSSSAANTSNAAPPQPTLHVEMSFSVQPSRGLEECGREFRWAVQALAKRLMAHGVRLSADQARLFSMTADNPDLQTNINQYLQRQPWPDGRGTLHEFELSAQQLAGQLIVFSVRQPNSAKVTAANVTVANLVPTPLYFGLATNQPGLAIYSDVLQIDLGHDDVTIKAQILTTINALLDAACKAVWVPSAALDLESSPLGLKVAVMPDRIRAAAPRVTPDGKKRPPHLTLVVTAQPPNLGIQALLKQADDTQLDLLANAAPLIWPVFPLVQKHGA